VKAHFEGGGVFVEEVVRNMAGSSVERVTGMPWRKRLGSGW
jgi:hypothetical protein